jgi:hypothetical protein
MDQFDSTLRAYAKSGLRTVEDWNERGRSIEPGATPRADESYRGTPIALFSRDQTRIRHSSHVAINSTSLKKEDHAQLE